MTQSVLAEYPFLSHVMKMQSDFLHQVGAEIPAELQAIQNDACVVIHTHSPLPYEEKEAAMVVVVLATSFPHLYEPVARIGNSTVRTAIAELRAANPRDDLTPLLSQAKTAIGIVAMRLTKTDHLTPQQAEAVRARGTNNDAEEKRNFINLNAPAMREEYARSKAALLARLDAIIQAPPPAAKPPAPPQF